MVAEVLVVAQIPARLVYLGKDMPGETEIMELPLYITLELVAAVVQEQLGVILQVAFQAVAEQGQHHP